LWSKVRITEDFGSAAIAGWNTLTASNWAVTKASVIDKIDPLRILKFLPFRSLSESNCGKVVIREIKSKLLTLFQ
jgi:hypothetical protein